VILLGGINDIGYGADNITVFEGLMHMYKVRLEDLLYLESWYGC
jgi:hypothetical protein